jgi:hypothetical protein
MTIQQFWGNGRHYHSVEDVRTEDHGQTVVLQLRDSEGYRYGTARMTLANARILSEYLDRILNKQVKGAA